MANEELNKNENNDSILGLESDSLDELGKISAEELEKFGIETAVSENSVTVCGELRAPRTALDSHNDHRIAMSLSVLCTVTGGVIDGAEAVAKSYPDFFRDLERTGAKTE